MQSYLNDKSRTLEHQQKEDGKKITAVFHLYLWYNYKHNY